MLKSYQVSCLLEISSKLKGIKWEPPSIGSYKVNVDGALFFNIQKARIGFTTHDHEVKVFLAAIIVEWKMDSPETIEALAVLRSFQLCMH